MTGPALGTLHLMTAPLIRALGGFSGRTRTVATITGVALALAVALRAGFATYFGATFGHPTRSGDGWTFGFATVGGLDPMVVLNAIALATVGATGIAVLGIGTTLVLAVIDRRGHRLPLLIAGGAVLAVGAAVATGVASQASNDFDTATWLQTACTGLAGIAGAALPAVVLGAVRARHLRGRP